MKKKWMQRGVSAALGVAMMLGLASCGRGAKGTMSTDPNLAKQYVYKCQDVELSDMGDNFSVQSGIYKDGRIYLLTSIYQYDEGSNGQKVKMLSMKEDGSDLQTVDFQLPGVPGGGDDQGADGNSDGDDQGSGDGDVTELPTPRTEEAAAEAVVEEPAVDVPIMEAPSFYEYTGYSYLKIADDGNVYGIKSYAFEDYSDPENYVRTEENSLIKWDFEGNLLSEYVLPAIDTQKEYLYLQSMVPMADGSVTVIYSGDTMQMCTVDAEGNVSERTPMAGDSDILQSGGNMMTKGDGELLLTYYDTNDWSKMFVATYDLKTNTAGEGVALPDSFMMSGYSAMMPGLTTDLVYTTSDGVYTLNIGDTQSQQLMSFVNSDMSTSNMSQVIMLDENRFVGVYSDSVTWESVIGIFTKVNPEDIPDKKTLMIAGNWVGFDIKKRVVEFNKSSSEYRIIVKEYNSYNTMEDYNAGYTQLNNDIISGNMPDILVVDAQLPLSNYISKGLIADVGELIEKDEELSQKEFLQNIVEAYSVKGKLYQVIPSFSVMTLTGKQSKVGDRTAWTMKDLQEAMKNMPEGASAFTETTRSYFLNMMMQYCGSDFVDVSSGKCDFNSQNFIDMLEFAKTLPAELGEDYYSDSYWQTYESQYREDRTLLMHTYISTIASMNSVINGSFGEPVSFIGFPTESGNGSTIMSSGDTFALSAKSKNQDGAWEFLRYYLTDEYQESLQWGLPVSKAIFDKKAEEALSRPYYIDGETGEKVEYDENFYMNGEAIPLEPMTKEQVDQVVNFITSVKTSQFYNEEINNIIAEEAEAFFNDQKSAQDVAGIIQSRVQIYVSENS